MVLDFLRRGDVLMVTSIDWVRRSGLHAFIEVGGAWPPRPPTPPSEITCRWPSSFA
jgi:hypothetical protein